MKIRKMESFDKEAVLDMMKKFYQSSAVIEKAPTSILKKDIEDCLSALPFIEGYIFEEDEIIGYAMIAKSYSTEFAGICIWLEDLYIEEAYRGKGIASTFINFIEEKYKGQIVRIRLEATSENMQAMKAYQKSGFTKSKYIALSKEYK